MSNLDMRKKDIKEDVKKERVRFSMPTISLEFIIIMVILFIMVLYTIRVLNGGVDTMVIPTSSSSSVTLPNWIIFPAMFSLIFASASRK